MVLRRRGLVRAWQYLQCWRLEPAVRAPVCGLSAAPGCLLLVVPFLVTAAALWAGQAPAARDASGPPPRFLGRRSRRNFLETPGRCGHFFSAGLADAPEDRRADSRLRGAQEGRLLQRPAANGASRGPSLRDGSTAQESLGWLFGVAAWTRSCAKCGRRHGWKRLLCTRSPPPSSREESPTRLPLAARTLDRPPAPRTLWPAFRSSKRCLSPPVLGHMPRPRAGRLAPAFFCSPLAGGGCRLSVVSFGLQSVERLP